MATMAGSSSTIKTLTGPAYDDPAYDRVQLIPAIVGGDG
jgi:hypothetical protein